MKVRPACIGDAAAIADIYRPYVAETVITFEDEAPESAAIEARMEAAGAMYPWLVAEGADGTIAGYAYACAFRARTAYRFSVETTVYVRQGGGRRGVGSLLYRPLLAALEAQGFTQAIAAISLPNSDSVGFHERFGFVQTGTYAQVGWKLGRWIDVGLWQRPLARAATPPREPRPLANV
ncbi:GNAT family N-acetyltransferase [Sphingosinicella sp. BN140058]|uniref:GNAT family N-acetyltransferase n=1 Tax=Sphingosinicella sp. BN140058 TaxID=1892855 RepID=UPI001011BDAC|nr:GNAT family N-acetyltransferase [Sphingosinicella sp. BN140058]QAY77661.1 N-acetyltransferase family protein [Sphingosinicella sp. BN140058]